MTFVGIDAVVYAADDMKLARRLGAQEDQGDPVPDRIRDRDRLSSGALSVGLETFAGSGRARTGISRDHLGRLVMEAPKADH